jgi:hypothetical protein
MAADEFFRVGLKLFTAANVAEHNTWRDPAAPA